MIKAKDAIKNMVPPFRGNSRSGAGGVLRLFANENPLGTPLAAVEAAKIAASKGSLYPEADGEELRRALGGRLGIAADQIFLGNGVDDLFRMLCQIFLEQGDEIILPHPSYGEYSRYAAMFGASAKYIPLNGDQVVDLPAMASAIRSRTKMVVFCNPNNPTATVLSKRLFLQTLHRIGTDVLVVVDESYIDYVGDADTVAATDHLKEFPNLVALRSFSHAYGLAGFRIAYAVAHREVAREAEKITVPYAVSAIAQSAALAAVQDKEFLKKSIRYNRVERDFMTRSLKTLGLSSLPGAANFLLVDMGMDAVAVCDFLREKGVLVCGGDLFGYPKAIRVSLGLREENEKLLEALKILLFRERKAKEKAEEK